MKAEKEYIRKVIKEELYLYLSEVALCHNKDTGYFDSCTAGNTYSLSKKGAKSGGVDSKFVKRGTLTKSKPRGDVPTTKTKFGVNSQKNPAGRIRIPSGDKISPKISVSKFPKRYTETRDLVLSEVSLAMAEWLKAQEHDYGDDPIEEASECDCAGEKRKSYQNGIKASLNFITALKRAEKGE